MKFITRSLAFVTAAISTVLCAAGACTNAFADIETRKEALASATAVLNASGIPDDYVQWVVKASKECAIVTAPLIAAQIEAESNWNPKAESHDKQGNPIAQGISQFTPGTWALHGVDGDGDGTADVWNPADAIISQAKYDCYLSKLVTNVVGDPVDLMLAAYNAGPGRVKAAGGVPNITETTNYIKRIKTLMLNKYTTTTGGFSGGSGFGERVLALAATQLGKPYVYGAKPDLQVEPELGAKRPPNFDCSSLVQYAVYWASDKKLTLPRTTQTQVVKGEGVTRAEIKIGDVLYFDLAPDAGHEVDHAGIYAGNNQMLHAPHTGDVVRYATISDSYWARANIRRFG